MSAAAAQTVLENRLERLTGEEGSCCLTDYADRAQKVRSLPQFKVSLKRVRAMADDRRLLALGLLKRSDELCACELQAATGLTHATVSHHMAVLQEAGLVASRKEGKWRYYRLTSRARGEVP